MRIIIFGLFFGATACFYEDGLPNVVIGNDALHSEEVMCDGFNFEGHNPVSYATGVSESEFTQALNEFEAAYQPIAKAKGDTLKVVRLWSSSTKNATALRTGNTVELTFYGGLFREPAMTKMGTVMVACHEAGHAYGGKPFYPDSNWRAANESQSDHFAALKCMRHIYRGTSYETTNQNVREKCDAVWSSADDRQICYRAMDGGISLGNVLASLNGRPNPNINTPDTRQVSQTQHAHQSPQIRLDTMVAGASCTASDAIWPSYTDARIGHCTSGVGQRPRSWFKPDWDDDQDPPDDDDPGEDPTEVDPPWVSSKNVRYNSAFFLLFDCGEGESKCSVVARGPSKTVVWAYNLGSAMLKIFPRSHLKQRGDWHFSVKREDGVSSLEVLVRVR